MDNIEELYSLLCSNGYLPPRNEDELLEQERKNADYSFKTAGKHIDSKAIAKGSCCRIQSYTYFDDEYDIAAEPLGMAARNFDKMPKNVINKIIMQHRKDIDGEEQ